MTHKDAGQAGSGEQVLAAIRARSLMRGHDAAVAEVAARHGTDGFTGEDMARIDRHNLLAIHASLSAENATLRAAASAFVAKLDAIHADPQYAGVWQLHQIHNGPYTGPQYSDELDALRSALSPDRKGP